MGFKTKVCARSRRDQEYCVFARGEVERSRPSIQYESQGQSCSKTERAKVPIESAKQPVEKAETVCLPKVRQFDWR